MGDATAHDREEGSFEVRFFNSRQSFSRLAEAYKAYFKADDAVSLWDITEGEIFLESKVFTG